MRPRLAGIEEDNLVSSKLSTIRSGGEDLIFTESMSFDTTFQGLALSMVDEIIRDIAPLNDGTSDDGVETIKLAPGEVFTEIDLFEGDAGLGLRVIYIDSFESLLTLFRCVQMQDVRNLSVGVRRIGC